MFCWRQRYREKFRHKLLPILFDLKQWNFDFIDLSEQVKVKKFTLSLYYVVGEYVSKNQQTQNFGDIFLEVINNAFSIYITERVSLLKSMTDIIASCYLSKKSGIVIIQKERRFAYKNLLSLCTLYGKNLLRYLNAFLSISAFKHIFLNCKPGKGYIDKNFKILNDLKWIYIYIYIYKFWEKKCAQGNILSYKMSAIKLIM